MRFSAADEAMPKRLLSGYPIPVGRHDEMLAAPGEPRPPGRAFVALLPPREGPRRAAPRSRPGNRPG